MADRDEKGYFKPGHSIKGGRPKGSRAKLGEAFMQDMQADWEKHGIEVIEAVRIDKPDQYLKVVASILPKELNVNVDPIEELTDDELTGLIAGLAKRVKIDIGESSEGTGTPPTVQ